MTEANFIVLGVGGVAEFDNYGEALGWAREEARAMSNDPFYAENGQVPIYAVSSKDVIYPPDSEGNEDE